MFKILSSKFLLLTFILSFIIFYPSLFTFYTNDDFFLLKISNASTFREFINFFDFSKGPEGLAMYRPLTIQVFYFVGRKLFALNPLWLHVIAFLFLWAVIYLVYRLAKTLTKREAVAVISALLYAISATHFGHLYYLAAFQELGVALFFLLSVIFFIKFIKKKDKRMYFFSLLSFLLALLSKETAVVVPFALILVYLYLFLTKEKVISVKKAMFSTGPFFIVLLFYLYYHFYVYGVASGESYIWDFSMGRALNTLSWYFLWSLNLPELLVDFVGPGLHINPNLFKFWSKEIMPIFILFGLLISFIAILFLKAIKRFNRKDVYLFLFCAGWFFLTLMPVIFLPLHKFTFYLTLPLIGIDLAISYIIYKAKLRLLLLFLFIFIYFGLSLFILNITRKTHWITRGSEVAKSVFTYINENESSLVGKTITFYDAPHDSDLPWSPTQTLKVILSNQNFFEVFFKDQFKIRYSEDAKLEEGEFGIVAREYLGY